MHRGRQAEYNTGMRTVTAAEIQALFAPMAEAARQIDPTLDIDEEPETTRGQTVDMSDPDWFRKIHYRGRRNAYERAARDED